jgi:hypothetical protein
MQTYPFRRKNNIKDSLARNEYGSENRVLCIIIGMLIMREIWITDAGIDTLWMEIM